MEEFITKKDLLVQEGISYGRLYRWKRLGLIPEEWFIKRAAPTGQETVLPKAKVTKRIAKIKELIKTMSLEEMAEKFAFDHRRQVISFDDLYKLKYLDIQYANRVGNYFKKDGYNAAELMMIICCADIADNEKFTVRQYVDLLRYALPLASKVDKTGVRCVFFAAGGDFHIAITDNTSPCLFDSGLRIVGDYNFETIWERLGEEVREL